MPPRASEPGPAKDEANLLLYQAITAKQVEQWGAAFDLLQRSADLARSHGDEALALRAEANAVALLADAGQSGGALELARQVRHRAAEAGLARPEGMVIATLVSLTNRGADVGEQLGALGLITVAEVLLDINRQIVAATVTDPAEREFETNDSGALDAQLAMVAKLHHASQLEADRYRVAADKAHRQGLRFELANRLAGLIAGLRSPGRAGRGGRRRGRVATAARCARHAVAGRDRGAPRDRRPAGRAGPGRRDCAATRGRSGG